MNKSSLFQSKAADPRLRVRHRHLRLDWCSGTDWYATRGYEIWHSVDHGMTWTHKSTLNTGWGNRICRFPLLAQVGRLGIHNLACLSSGTILCVTHSVVHRSIDGGVTFVPVFTEFRGRRPLRQALCEDDTGRVYLGEYWLNEERDAVRLWRSDDDGVNWFAVHTWPAGSIRHIHFVQFDAHEKLLWVGTGDRGPECQIACSRDGGVSFSAVGRGSQIWRAVSALFTPEAILWGTDIGMGDADQPNYIVRWDRSTGALEKLMQTSGPVYYSAQTLDGVLVIGRAVEKGQNETDRNVHLYWSRDHHTWESVRLWRRYPSPAVCGPAAITFPVSNEPLPRLFFNVQMVLSRHNGSMFEFVV